MRRYLAVLFAIWALVMIAPAQTKPYPKPQIASAAGKLVPDFALRDQNADSFKLSGQRGHWVLLYFYRGYW